MKTSRFRVGDHLVAQRLGHTHHGLYIGSDQVVHYVSSLDGLVNRNNKIGVTSVNEFSQGYPIKIKLHDTPYYNPEEAADRACLQIGHQDYALTNHCEQFVNWCLEGEQQYVSANLSEKWPAIQAHQQTQRVPFFQVLKKSLSLIR